MPWRSRVAYSSAVAATPTRVCNQTGTPLIFRWKCIPFASCVARSMSIEDPGIVT